MRIAQLPLPHTELVEHERHGKRAIDPLVVAMSRASALAATATCRGACRKTSKHFVAVTDGEARHHGPKNVGPLRNRCRADGISS